LSLLLAVAVAEFLESDSKEKYNPQNEARNPSAKDDEVSRAEQSFAQRQNTHAIEVPEEKDCQTENGNCQPVEKRLAQEEGYHPSQHPNGGADYLLVFLKQPHDSL